MDSGIKERGNLIVPGQDVVLLHTPNTACRVLSVHHCPEPSSGVVFLLVCEHNNPMRRLLVSARSVMPSTIKPARCSYRLYEDSRREKHPYFHHPFYPGEPPKVEIDCKKEEEDDDLSYLENMDELFATAPQEAEEEAPQQTEDELKLFDEEDHTHESEYDWILEESYDIVDLSKEEEDSI